ncbi:MAG: sulfatase [Planctomycetes bacterium]|nr:sulfatase [Planctomycetota bacterium]
MNLIVIMLDSLRQDHVSFYGWDGCPVETPNLDAFASESVVFDNCYPEGLPTIPVRTELHTGQHSLVHRPWQPLEPTDVTLAQTLRAEGYLNCLVADTYHLFKPDMNFHRAFHCFRWIRGNECDAYRSAPLRNRKLEDYVLDTFPDWWRDIVHQYLKNVDEWVEPEDFACYRTMDTALGWLERNRSERPKFLWIDTFQNHEPWNPPAEFDRFVPDDYDGPRVIMPMGGNALDWGSEEIIGCVRGLYAGEVAYVDWCLGKVFGRLREMGYMDDSLVCVLADHGHPLADHGKFLKGTDRMHSELLKAPLMIRFPGARFGGKRLDALAQFPDLMPTWLDALGLSPAAHDLAGKSLMPVIRGERDAIRDVTISGYHVGVERAIRDKRYGLVIRPEGEPDELYDLIEDPRERINIIEEKPEVADRLSAMFPRAYLPQPHRSRGAQGDSEVADTPVQ